MWDTEEVLVLRHYKLLKLFSHTVRQRTLEQVSSKAASQYHSRTTENIARIFGQGASEAIQALLGLPSRPISEGFLKSLVPRRYRAGGDDTVSAKETTT